MLWGCEKESPYIFDIPDFNITDSEPAWSPCGEWIAFSHGDTVPGKSGIYKISPDGEEIHQLHGGGQAPAWSPCGQWIAFSQGAQIWKKKINGDSLTQLTFEGRNFNPRWGQESNLIAYRRSYAWPEESSVQGIWLVDPYSDNVKQIFSGNCGSPEWLDNENLVFFRGLIDKDGRMLYKISTATQQCSDLIYISEAYRSRYPRYSLNNDKIAFTLQKNKEKPQIWTMNIDGTDRKQLTHTQAYSCDWSPCGKYIVYTDSRRENGRLWIMDADGSNKRQLTFEHHF